jgi:putative restriction endonuclease
MSTDEGREITHLTQMRLEKAAADCGFERSVEREGDFLVLRSAQFPESVTVLLLGEEQFLIRASAAILSVGDIVETAELRVAGWAELYDRLGRAASIGRTLPDRIAQRFHESTAVMPNSTEAERLVIQRIGQDLFRAALLDYWQGRCCVTGLAIPQVLRASHIKPWAQCSSDEERLDVFNGLLLAPHLDALFDVGFMTFSLDGEAVWSPALPDGARNILGISTVPKLSGLRPRHEAYLAFHRAFVFNTNGSIQSAGALRELP